MNFYAKSSACTLCLSILVGCSTITDPINHLRQHRQDQGSVEFRKKTANNRSAAIQDSETAFSPAIACLSDHWLEWQTSSTKVDIEDTKKQLSKKIADANLKGNLKPDRNNRFDFDEVLAAIKNEEIELQKTNKRLLLERRLIDKKIDDGGNITKKIQKDGNISITQYRGISQQERSKYLTIETALTENTERSQELSSLRSVVNEAKAPIQGLRSANKFFRISVSPVFDKTGKIYDKDSTALSDLITHALTYNTAINVVDTPYNSDSAVISRATIKDATSFGQAFPTNMFISGALVQYDEGDAKPYLDYLRLNLDTVDLSKEIKSVTVGLALRLVQSDDSSVYYSKFFASPKEANGKEIAKIEQKIKTTEWQLDELNKGQDDEDEVRAKIKENEETLVGLKQRKEKLLGDSNNFETLLTGSKSPSVLMENTFFTQDMGGGILRIIGSKNWSVDTHVTVSDPKMYAVREMIERAVYELLKRAVPEYELSANSVKYRGWQSSATKCDDKLPLIPTITNSTTH